MTGVQTCALPISAGAALDAGTRGPAVDPSLRTTRAGVFAAGNLLHGAEPADVAALSGRHAAATVVRHLEGERWPTARLPIECHPPLRWIAPNVVDESSTAPSRNRFLLRAHEVLALPLVDLSQNGRSLWRGRLPRVGPGRSARLPAGWTDAVDPRGAPILARVIDGRRPSHRRPT